MKTPITFVSYSWDTQFHREWVLNLATKLTENGVEVILDQWHLHLGMDRLCFMEQSVERSDRVLLIGTPQFAVKSASRVGGVGWETSIVTAELAEDLSQSKFIPVLRHGDFKKSFPSWLKSRTGVDLSADPYSDTEFQTLLQDLHNETPQPPPLGRKPSFVKSAPALPSPLSPTKTFAPVNPGGSPGRFRNKGVALGAKWDQLPFSTTHREVTLAEGPVIWLRLWPSVDAGKTWTTKELQTAGTQNGSWLLPFFGSTFWNLRAGDGFGIYTTFDPTLDVAFGIAFAFETGEVWAVDTHLLSHNGEIYFADLAKELVSKLPEYGAFLQKLGVTGPFHWEAGLSGIHGMRLVRPSDAHIFQRPVCLVDEVKASGLFSPGEDSNAVLHPLFRKLFDKCGLDAPAISQLGTAPTLNQLPKMNAVAYSFFERKGSEEQVKLYIRPTERSGLFNLETVPGGQVSAQKNAIADIYQQKIRELEREGFTRMNSMNATTDRKFD